MAATMHNIRSSKRYKTRVPSLFVASGKSLSQIARETGCSLSNISRIRAGRRTVSLEYAGRLAPALGVDLLTLLHAIVSDRGAA